MLIPNAHAEVRIASGCTLYLGGPRARRREAMDSAWAYLRDGGLGKRLTAVRAGTQSTWSDVDEAVSATRIWGRPGPCRRLQACTGAWLVGAALEMVDVEPVFGTDRASSISVRFAEHDEPNAMVQLACWAAAHLPLHWGTAGWFFQIDGGRNDIAWSHIAALAKRHWAVQIAEPSAMQWDALAGLPSVGWLTLVGHELAESAGLSIADAPPAGSQDLYWRKERFGTVFAAGTTPVHGDINVNAPLRPYRMLDELLQPVRLRTVAPWSGAFARAEVQHAWMNRFQEPDAWLSASIDDE